MSRTKRPHNPWDWFLWAVVVAIGVIAVVLAEVF